MTYINPALVKVIITHLPAEWLAFSNLVSSASLFVVGLIWKGKLRDKVIKNFVLFAILESICGFLLAMYLCFVQFNVWVFAIFSLIYSSLISTFVGKCVMFFKSVFWNNKDREIYDNNYSIVTGIVCIVGYIIAIIAMPPLKVSLFLWGLSCIIDDIGWIYVILKNPTQNYLGKTT